MTEPDAFSKPADRSETRRVQADPPRGARSSPPRVVVPVHDADAALAAIQYGADSLLYYAPSPFSPNPEDFSALLGHAAAAGKEVLVHLGGPVEEAGLPAAARLLAECEDLGVDAVVLDDFGALRLVRESFPRLTWHGGLSLAVRSPEDARWLARNGFRRAMLAPDLAGKEVAPICGESRLELCAPVFLSRRAALAAALRADPESLPELGDDTAFAPGPDWLRLPGLAAVAAMDHAPKAAYSAALADYLGAAVRGDSDPARDGLVEMLFHCGGREPDEPGPRLGEVARVHGGRAIFRAALPFGRGDDIVLRKGNGRCIAFRADRINQQGRRVFRAAAGDEVSIPAPPEAEAGDVLHLSALHAVERKYPVAPPQRKERSRMKVRLDVVLQVDPGGPQLKELGLPGKIVLTCRWYHIELTREYDAKLLFAHSQPMEEHRLREFFLRLGGTAFELGDFRAVIPAGVFVPAAEINEARRCFFAEFESLVASSRAERVEKVCAVLSALPEPIEGRGAGPMEPKEKATLSAFAGSLDDLEALADTALAEVVLDLGAVPREGALAALQAWGDRLRFAVPPGMHPRLAGEVLPTVKALYGASARKFQAADGGGFELLAHAAGIEKVRRPDTDTVVNRTRRALKRRVTAVLEPRLPDFESAGMDLVADVVGACPSREAARSWLEQGAGQIALRGDPKLLEPMLAEFGPRLCIALGSPAVGPLAFCLRAALAGRCKGLKDCDFEKQAVSRNGDEIVAVNRSCMTWLVESRGAIDEEGIAAFLAAGARNFRLDLRFGSASKQGAHQRCERMLEALAGR